MITKYNDIINVKIMENWSAFRCAEILIKTLNEQKNNNHNNNQINNYYSSLSKRLKTIIY